MDLTVLNVALPSIAAELQPSAALQLWMIDIDGFMVAGFLITRGNLGGRIGRRRLRLLGCCCSAAASGRRSAPSSYAASRGPHALTVLVLASVVMSIGMAPVM